MFYKIFSSRIPGKALMQAVILVMLAFSESGANNAVQSSDDQKTTRLGPEELAVIVNDADPISVKVAEYYISRRLIPKPNVIHVSFTPGQLTMKFAEFKKVKAMVDAATPPNVQAYALTWTIPYGVECMSITSAFAMGFDDGGYCSAGCKPTKLNPYFNSNSHRPYDDYHIRPTMSLVGMNFEQVKALIDRGITSDFTFPKGVGYLVSTTDKARNVRAFFYPEIIQKLGGIADLHLVTADFIKNKKGILYYFIGAMEVKALDSLQFLPGAIADHLTSTGGQLTNSSQMSSLRWLEAGVTGSYGNITEPCNYPHKFPHPGIVISHYYHGESLIEAYWKSVAWPSQGIFIGEPLATPFAVLTRPQQNLMQPER
jgi:uncharacterized protein (TIGR03790 family)